MRGISHGKGQIYPGLRYDARTVSNPSSLSNATIPAFVVVPLCVMDAVPSAAFDTLLLPVDLFKEYTRKKQERAHEQQTPATAQVKDGPPQSNERTETSH
jgi:hypothetical protein